MNKLQNKDMNEILNYKISQIHSFNSKMIILIKLFHF